MVIAVARMVPNGVHEADAVSRRKRGASPENPDL